MCVYRRHDDDTTAREKQRAPLGRCCGPRLRHPGSRGSLNGACPAPLLFFSLALLSLSRWRRRQRRGLLRLGCMWGLGRFTKAKQTVDRDREIHQRWRMNGEITRESEKSSARISRKGVELVGWAGWAMLSRAGVCTCAEVGETQHHTGGFDNRWFVQEREEREAASSEWRPLRASLVLVHDAHINGHAPGRNSSHVL